jgi:hypothetical protein
VNDDLDLDDARKRYHLALAPEDYESQPFYSALLGELEVDDVAVRLLASVRAEQRNPMLVLAALQLAGLKGHPVLGPIYDDARRGELREPNVAARHVLDVIHETPSVLGDELWRSTQTNEPGRSAVIQAVVRRSGAATSLDQRHRSRNVGGHQPLLRPVPGSCDDDGNPLTLVCEDVTPVDDPDYPEVRHARGHRSPSARPHERRRSTLVEGLPLARTASPSRSLRRGHRRAHNRRGRRDRVERNGRATERR